MNLELNPNELEILMEAMNYFLDGLKENATEHDYNRFMKLYYKVERVK